MITDVWFYLAAIPAVFFYGMGKGGVGGILGILSVPLMAMIVPPVQAAAILLPLLCVMDLIALHYHRRNCDYREIKLLLPTAIIGIVIASYFMGRLPSYLVQLMIGILALLFLVQKFIFGQSQHSSALKGRVLALISGFSSALVHAGGPPFSMYLLPKNLPKAQLIGTGVVFFAIMNFIKLIPYAYIGELDGKNLLTSALLIPIAFLGVKFGAWLVTVISQELIYKISYFILFITACKMLYSGFMGMI